MVTYQWVLFAQQWKCWRYLHLLSTTSLSQDSFDVVDDGGNSLAVTTTTSLFPNPSFLHLQPTPLSNLQPQLLQRPTNTFAVRLGELIPHDIYLLMSRLRSYGIAQWKPFSHRLCCLDEIRDDRGQTRASCLRFIWFNPPIDSTELKEQSSANKTTSFSLPGCSLPYWCFHLHT